ncbi:FkbM family methyltransferase [Bradyrhizobium sp. Rc2d]|uniref:FkbM family methyltransferase n=1 Tax=unclassified Bradyrhizobium TaxID=2631580 RepID=UPI00088BEFB2|nr:FkbM family methyltransferase [Bradyrhizobium sp. Rc2d]SDI50964.1 methyltransferase, FkbM family [Bradyrhizobium sp. Rc2d]
MNTAQKIAIARKIYKLVRSMRSALGLKDTVVVSRNGIVYELDLSEGIDLAIYLNDYFERNTRRALDRLVVPSSVVLDIGANIGAHTLHLAKLVGPEGRVLAFEPTDFAYGKLSRNIELNPTLAPRIKASQSFVTCDTGSSVPEEIYSSWPLESGDQLHARHLGRKMTASHANAVSVDGLHSEIGDRVVNLIKLDVDGFECDVLRGARETLRGPRPVFVMELAPHVLNERGSSLDELVSFFVPNGYLFHDERSFEVLPSTAEGLSRMIPTNGSINVVARPN